MSNPTIFGGLIRPGSGVKLPSTNKTGLQGLADLLGPISKGITDFAAANKRRARTGVIARRRADGWTPGNNR